MKQIMFGFPDAFDQHVKITLFELEFNLTITTFFYGKRCCVFLFFPICDHQLKDSVWKFFYKFNITGDKIQSSVLVYSDRALC